MMKIFLALLVLMFAAPISQADSLDEIDGFADGGSGLGADPGEGGDPGSDIGGEADGGFRGDPVGDGDQSGGSGAEEEGIAEG